MGELKPLGSEKLSGDQKLKRILELTYYNEPKKTKLVNKPEMVKESVIGGVFGIVKEKDGYYVKQGLNENSLDYIGGLFMKNKNRFSSYAEASKRMNLLLGSSNLNESTKYVLKQKSNEQSPKMPSPDMPSPDMSSPDMSSPDMPSPDSQSSDMPSPDMSSPDSQSSDMPSPNSNMDKSVETNPEGGNSNKRSDYMSEIQKYSGKLGQELRDQHQKMESDDIKYVLNMVISAVDLDKLDLEDIEEIGKKFNRDEEEPTSDDTEMPSDSEEPSPEESEGDLGENMSKLDEFIKMSAPQQENEISLERYADIEESDDELKELDLDEMKSEINQRINDTLSKYFNR
jgi:hypothetical protein